jgi:phosphatidate cytidylyltransferase
LSVLGKRVLSAIVAILFLIFMFWIGGWFFNLVLVFVSLIGMKEIYHSFSNKGMYPQRWSGYLIIIFFYLQHFLFHGIYDFFYFIIATVLLLSMMVWMPSVKPEDIAITLLGLLYPGVLLSTASLIKESAFIDDYYLLYISLTATYGTDTFAYFVGSFLGKRKLCPAISPNKTIEGSIGGLAGGIILVILLGFILNWVYNINVHPIHFAIIGLLGGVFSQIGDLTASSIKRYCNVKDFGNIMPGHGGILDRIDSLLFVLPVVYVYSQLFLVG